MDYLFSEGDMYALIERLGKQLAEEIQAQDGDYILNASETDLVTHFVEEYSIDVPELDQDAIYVRDQQETQIDISGDPFRHFSMPGPHYRTGTSITISVPFSGDGRLFRFRPNQFTHSPPRAKVSNDELLLVYTGLGQTGEQIRSEYQSDVSTISQWLGWMRTQAEPYNSQLEGTVRKLIEERRAKVLADRSLVQNIGLPIKPRPGEAKTYTVPTLSRPGFDGGFDARFCLVEGEACCHAKSEEVSGGVVGACDAVGVRVGSPDRACRG